MERIQVGEGQAEVYDSDGDADGKAVALGEALTIEFFVDVAE